MNATVFAFIVMGFLLAWFLAWALTALHEPARKVTLPVLVVPERRRDEIEMNCFLVTGLEMEWLIDAYDRARQRAGVRGPRRREWERLAVEHRDRLRALGATERADSGCLATEVDDVNGIIERQWTAHGLDCAVLRMDSPRMAHRCGYVAVPKSHPWHGLGYARVVGRLVVHGGVTFADRAPSALPGDWWFGFDCAHAGDTPAEWTEERVAQEVERFAEQIAVREPFGPS